MGLIEYAVTRARDDSNYRRNKKLTGIVIGKGKIKARIYDKYSEIINKSNKIWMFDVWKIDQPPQDNKIIRVEFQLRREALKELLINQIDELFQFEANIWARLTTQWLKFQDRPGTHHTQRETLEWWKKVQCGYNGSQDANPALRIKAVRNDQRRLALQMFGLMSSLQASELEKNQAEEDHQAKIEDCLDTLKRELIHNKKDIKDLNNNIRRKRPKYFRPKERREYENNQGNETKKEKDENDGKKEKDGKQEDE
jgi:hypothetical protein